MTWAFDEKQVLYAGAKCLVIAAAAGNGRLPAIEYLDVLREKYPDDHAVVLAQLMRIGDHEPNFRNDRKFKHLQEGIHELKCGLHRMFCFRSRNVWFFTSGCLKPKPKALAAEMKKARAMRSHQMSLLE